LKNNKKNIKNMIILKTKQKKKKCKKKQVSSEVSSRVPWVNVFLVNTKQKIITNYPDLVSFWCDELLDFLFSF